MHKITFEHSSGSRQMFEGHYHDEIEIYFLIKGQRYYFVNDETHLVMPRNLVIIKENLSHKVFSAGYSYYERYLLNINREFISSHFSEEIAITLFKIFDEEKFVYRLKDPSKVENIFHEMHIIGQSQMQDISKQEIINELTVSLFTEIKKSLQDSSAEASEIVYVNKNILQIADYINNNYSEKITLSDLSNKFGLSKYYLCKLFKKSLGYTFSDFLNNVRIMEARRLLETTNLSVSNISDTIGYSNIAYFCRVFKNIMDISALKYRKSAN